MRLQHRLHSSLSPHELTFPALYPIHLQRWVSESAYGTWEWSGLFSTLDANLKDTYAAANDTMKPAVERQIRTLETRAQSFWEAQVGWLCSI